MNKHLWLIILFLFVNSFPQPFGILSGYLGNNSEYGITARMGLYPINHNKKTSLNGHFAIGFKLFGSFLTIGKEPTTKVGTITKKTTITQKSETDTTVVLIDSIVEFVSDSISIDSNTHSMQAGKLTEKYQNKLDTFGFFSITVGYQNYLNLVLPLDNVNSNFALGMGFVSVFFTWPDKNVRSKIGIGISAGFPTVGDIDAEYKGIVLYTTTQEQEANVAQITINSDLFMSFEPILTFIYRLTDQISFNSDLSLVWMPFRNIKYTAKDQMISSRSFLNSSREANILLPAITIGIQFNFDIKRS